MEMSFLPPFEFKRHGQSGIPVSSIFPRTAKMVDEMAVIRSMTSKVNEHAQGNYAIHTGFPLWGILQQVHGSVTDWAI